MQNNQYSIKPDMRVLVVGMARSGIAAAHLLLQCGAIPVLSDHRVADSFGNQLQSLLDTPCEFLLGEKNAKKLLKDIDLVVISPGVPLEAPIVKQAALLHIPLIGELELAASQLKGTLIAITGTNGKTTTVSLLGQIFEDFGKTVHIGGNIGYPLSSIAMTSHDADIVIAEVSSFQLETIRAFHPGAAALLNITEDHLDRHHTMEAYVNLKKKIFMNQTSADIAVINKNDPLCLSIAKDIASNIVYFSSTHPIEHGVCLHGDTVVSVADSVVTPICNADEIMIPGPHNLENAMVAIAIALAYDVSPSSIKHTLRTFSGVEHRIETVRTVHDITYINDSKGTNVASTLKAIQSMKTPTVIILGGYDKHTSFDPLCQAVASSPYIKHAVLIGQTAKMIAEAFDKADYNAVTHAYSLEDAVTKAASLCSANWNVLFSPACASFDMFVDYEHRGRAFKEIVMNM